MSDNLKLSKRKRAWRDGEFKDCIFAELEDGQEFRGGKKLLLIYPSNKIADGGYVDAEWTERVEIHHILDKECRTYYTERSHDGVTFDEAFTGGSFVRGSRPHPNSIRIQRDGAVQISIYDDFSFHSYQAFEIRGLAPPNHITSNR